jgi:hypothetical protein
MKLKLVFNFIRRIFYPSTFYVIVSPCHLYEIIEGEVYAALDFNLK